MAPSAAKGGSLRRQVYNPDPPETGTVFAKRAPKPQVLGAEAGLDDLHSYFLLCETAIRGTRLYPNPWVPGVGPTNYYREPTIRIPHFCPLVRWYPATTRFQNAGAVKVLDCKAFAVLNNFQALVAGGPAATSYSAHGHLIGRFTENVSLLVALGAGEIC